MFRKTKKPDLEAEDICESNTSPKVHGWHEETGIRDLKERNSDFLQEIKYLKTSG